MTIRQLKCPGCSAVVNVPAAMANVRCSACGTVWNANQPVPSQQQAIDDNEPEDEDEEKGVDVNLVGTILIGGFVFLICIGILAAFVMRVQRKGAEERAAAAAAANDTIKPREPEPYRVVNLPEEHRRRIYDDVRKVARTTVETPLAIPTGTKVRKNVEDMLDKTYQRELSRFAALHDITIADVQEIIKEGDALNWDTRARSHATRDGKRVYAEEKSEGWKMKEDIR